MTGALQDALLMLAVVLALLLLLPAAVLAVPLGVEFHVERTHTTRGRATLHWLFGLVRVRIDPTAAAGPTPAAPRQRAAPGRSGGRGLRSGTRALRLLRDAAWRRRVLRLARDLLRVVQWRHLSLRARLGLGDPADTGMLWALLGPLGAVGRQMARIDLQLQPDFVHAVCEIDARGECVLVPLRVLWMGLSFVLSPTTWRAWYGARLADA